MPDACKGKLAGENDEDLVALVHRGDQDAVSVLISRYMFLIRMRSRSVAVLGIELEDLVQEGTIAFLSAIQSFDIRKNSSFHAYANLCIRRRMVTAYRSAHRRKCIPFYNCISLDDMTNAQTVALSNEVNPEDLLICREESDLLQIAVGRLTASELGLLKMYISGASYWEMAEKTDAGVKQIDYSLQKIKRKLKLLFQG